MDEIELLAALGLADFPNVTGDLRGGTILLSLTVENLRMLAMLLIENRQKINELVTAHNDALEA